MTQSTGLVCPKCKKPVAVLDHQPDHAGLAFQCPACGHQWRWEDQRKATKKR